MAHSENQTDWDTMWDEASDDARAEGARGRFAWNGRKRKRLDWLPSTKLLVIATAFWIGAILLIVLGFVAGNTGTNSFVLGFFLVCLVVSSIAGAFASFLSLFGLFKYRRRKILNLLLLIISIVTNPLILIMVATTGVA
ncbi:MULTISPECIES: hypothetical protein [Micrococcaceae]|uniref:hypothetical protein n=1 Tax=unclassified Kocuria TaxID=2649579 RepID=UPI00101314F2|nr:MULTISPECIES: hypothetical protein [unclassified Kocuria]